MKKISILAVLFLSMSILQKSTAQLKVNVNLNIGSQPTWGPVGYDHVDYYYMPDIDAYYYVPQRQFIYLEGNRWVFASALPPRYGSYDLYHGYKVVVNEPRPYMRPQIYREKYKVYRGRRDQEIIRDSHDERYKNNGRGNSDHQDNGNGKNKGHGNGNGNGNGKGHGKGHGKD
jgi:hypothetical protein